MAYQTYFDLVESLIVSSYGGPQDAEQRDIRTAIHRAYDELTTIRDWAYYHVHGRLITRAPQSATLGSDTNLANNVLSTGGLPASDYTHVRIGDRIGEIVACLDPPTNTAWSLSPTVTFLPGTVNQGDTATFYKTVYALPSNFRNLDEPSDEYNWWSGLYVTPDQAMKIERVSNSSGAPYHWTIIKDPNSSGWAIKLVGYPTEAETIDFIYRRTARPIRYSGHEAALRQGTITRSGKNVTGSGTAFPADAVGSVLRVGDTTNIPGPIESLTPWISESVITARSSATAIQTVDSGTIAATTKYLITDPIDIAPHMHAAMDSCCDYWLARIRGVKTDEAFSLYQRDLRLAMEQDQLAPLSGRSRYVWHDGGWRSPLLPDVG
jgi:hypothetical protein